LPLPFVIKLTNIGELDPVLPEHEQRAGIKLRLDTVALDRLRGQYASVGEHNTLIRAFTEKLKNEIEGHRKYLAPVEVCSSRALERQEYQQIMSEIHALQRKDLFKMKNEKTFTDEAIRRAENLLDINDVKITESLL
jgi:CPA1 family monovalent cation:H+ antiporter